MPDIGHDNHSLTSSNRLSTATSSSMDRKTSRRNVENGRPGPKHHQALPLNIKTQATPPAMQPSPTPSQPYPNYPLPILGAEKIARALELYMLYCDAQLKEKLEKENAEPRSAVGYHGYHLNVPGPATAKSVISYTPSRIRAGSVTQSAYGAATESVVSFEDENSPTSAAGELTSYHGKKVKQRTRKKLTPVTRAKAALVRHLVSCWVCRSRRVKCPLEHHDIALLDRLRNEKLQVQPPRPSTDSGSSISSSSQQTATSISTWKQGATGASQTDVLMGIGERPDLQEALGNLDTTQLDIQTPGGDAYGDIDLDMAPPATISYVAPDMPGYDPNPYTSYQDGQMIAIGVQREGGNYFCAHLGLCNAYFDNEEDLQLHFEKWHFAYTRIYPAHRFQCSSCFYLNTDIMGPCSSPMCFQVGTIELWIYGSYIRNPPFQRYAPDPQDVAYTPSTLFSFNSFMFEDMNQGQDMNGSNYGGNANSGNFNYPNSNPHGGSQFGYEPSNHSGYSTNHFQGSSFNGARQLASDPLCAGTIYQKIQAAPQPRKQLLILLLALLAIVVLSFTHDWLLAKARQELPRMTAEIQVYLPLLGLVSMMASFGMGLSDKTLTTQRSRHPRSRLLSLHPIAKSTLTSSRRSGHVASMTLILGGRFS